MAQQNPIERKSDRQLPDDFPTVKVGYVDTDGSQREMQLTPGEARELAANLGQSEDDPETRRMAEHLRRGADAIEGEAK